MNISVVGTGHVGLTTAACLAHVGHDVLGIDDDAEKVARIAGGEMPFYEPGLGEMVREGLDHGRLRMSTDPADAAPHGDVVFICVGTPVERSGEASLVQVERVTRIVARTADRYTVVAEKSTVPVETAVWIRKVLEMEGEATAGFDVAANPEFLREGLAIQDTMEPDRIVVGSDSERAVERLREVYRPILQKTGCPFVVTDLATAELIKHASNAFLATKISFINSIAEVCERTGADVETVAEAMGLDPRIGSGFLKAGLGFGGSCLPKDIRAFQYRARELGVELGMVAEAQRVNEERLDSFVEKIRSVVWNLEGKRIALWGLSFKPETDDLRFSPAIEVARRLIERGASVVAYDPVAMPGSKPLLPDVTFASDLYEAADGADCVAICTKWNEFATADLGRVREAMAQPVIVDGRNMFQPEEMQRAGFTYASTGRPTVHPARG